MNIEELIDAVIGREGAYSNHPADTGGPTRWGVTEQVARANGFNGDMREFPRETAVAIYRATYWTRPGFDQIASIAPSLAAEMFDAGINMGPARATGFLQRALNVLNRGAVDYPDISTDGQSGPMTLFALRGYRAKRPAPEGDAVLLWTVRALRTGRYVEIAEASKSQEAFEYGWIARQLRAAA